MEKEKTVQDVLDTFNEEQMEVLQFMMGWAVQQAAKNKNKKEE